MLIATNPLQLGDELLDPIETLAKVKEENKKVVEKQKLPNQAELEDVERSGGSYLPYQEILRRLWLCNPHIVVKDGLPGHIALYAEVLNDMGEREERYMGGIPKKAIPEYSHIIVDERGLPKREVRGWRIGVLVPLIENQVITYQQAVKHFGQALGTRAWRWNQVLRAYKS